MSRTAARAVAVPFVSEVASEPPSAKPPPRKEGTARAAWARWANWVVGLSASAFLLIALGGYLYHRGQLAEIAAEHLRLMVTGPARITIGVAQRYTARTTTVTGHAVPAQVEFAWYGADGQQLMAHKEAADEQGVVNVTVEADAQWQPVVRMEVVATHSTRMERVETQLAVEPQGYLTALCLAQPRCRQGETLRYRSLTLSRFALAADRELPIRFEIRAPNGSLVADSVREGITVKGAGWGEYSIPRGLPQGVYRLRVIGLDDSFPEVERPFAILASRSSESKFAETEEQSNPIPSGGTRVDFRPEGGELVAGMENRVFFAARDGAGKPVQVSGRIVDGEDRAVAVVETSHEGMGSVQFEPQVGRQYRLKIDRPPEGQAEITLPPVSGNHSVVLTTGLGVVEAGAPLEFNIRAMAADVPLLAVASCRGIEVGQQTLVTSSGANAVTIPLHEEAAGSLRLALYEYRATPPRLVAERLVYRRPRKRFEVTARLEGLSLRPGQNIDVPLCVTDEQGRPAPADLSVAAFVVPPLGATTNGKAAPSSATNLGKPTGSASRETVFPFPSGLAAQLLLLGELEGLPTFENVESYLFAEGKAAALDLLLGAYGRGQPGAADRGERASAPAARSDCPPMVFDNLRHLIERYQASLTSYRVNRTRVLNAMTTLSFFGGIGLVMFVAMLSLLNVPCGLRLWAPAMGVAAACVVIGAVLMDPERLKRNPGGDIPFASFEPPISPGPARETSVGAAGRQNLRAFSPLAVEKPGGPEGAAGGGGSPACVAWHPLVSTDPQGHASVRVQLPARPGSCRLLVDAHAISGRLGASSIPMSYPEDLERGGSPPLLSGGEGAAPRKESGDGSSHPQGANSPRLLPGGEGAAAQERKR